MVCHKAACSERFSLIYTALILPIYSVTIQHMYADATLLYVEFPNGPLEHSTSDAERMSGCITDVKTWLTQHKLALNDKKTEAIRITTVSTCHPRPAVIHVGAHAVQSKPCYYVRHFRSPSPQTAGLAELCCTVDNGNLPTGAHFTSHVCTALVTHSPAHQIQTAATRLSLSPPTGSCIPFRTHHTIHSGKVPAIGR